MLAYPPRELWHEKMYNLPELSYSVTLNACYELLDANLALGRGSHPAIYTKNSLVTYAQLADEVVKIAGALRQRGVGPGDCVLIRLLNRSHFVAAFLATLRIGAVALPTAPLLRQRELEAIIHSADPVLIVSETDLWKEIANMPAHAVPCANVEELHGSPPFKECAPTHQDAPAIVLYTSGSTG